LLYSVVLAPLAVLPAFLGYAGVFYALVSIVGGLGFIQQALRLSRAVDLPTRNKAAGKIFGFSILYLFAVFAVMLGEDIVERSTGFALAMPQALTLAVGG
jgi:protoheme IX farnesyltransferase